MQSGAVFDAIDKTIRKFKLHYLQQIRCLVPAANARAPVLVVEYQFTWSLLVVLIATNRDGWSRLD